MNSSKVLLGVLGGVAAGALMGILFAPEKGSKTRKKIGNKKKGLADDMKAKFDNLYVDVTGKYKNLLQDSKKLAPNKETK